MQAIRISCRRAAAVGRARGRRAFGAPAMGPKPKDGVLFGDSKPGRVWQDWEATTYATYLASFTVITVGLTYAPRTSIKAWARDEALARNDLEGEAEYGTCYSGGDGKFKFVKGAVGERPALAGSEDEDDE